MRRLPGYSSAVTSLGLTSSLLADHGFSHRFFTRRGGVSKPPYATLSFSTGVGDCPQAVLANLKLAAEALGVDHQRVYYLDQMHGIDWCLLSGDEDRDEVLTREGDITVTTSRDVACGVRTADCVPVLLADPLTGAVAAAHAGWRGTVAGVVPTAVRVLLQVAQGGQSEVVATTGRPTAAPSITDSSVTAMAGRLLAAVGPHIEQCCFEVGADVAETIAACSSLGDTVVDRSRVKPHIDLRQVVAQQLASVGVQRVDQVAGCTVCDRERFHSYRRDGKRSGRMMAAIVGRGPLANDAS